MQVANENIKTKIPLLQLNFKNVSPQELREEDGKDKQTESV